MHVRQDAYASVVRASVSVTACLLCLAVTGVVVYCNGSKVIEQWQCQCHDNAHDNLQGQPHLHIISKRIAASLHHESVGRR